MIREGLAEAIATRKRVPQLIADLGSDDFKAREAASRTLSELGFRALPEVLEAAENSPSPEARQRAAVIVNGLSRREITLPPHGLVGDHLRLVRAVQVLDEIGGAEAKKLLQQIAAGGGPEGDAASSVLNR